MRPISVQVPFLTLYPDVTTPTFDTEHTVIPYVHLVCIAKVDFGKYLFVYSCFVPVVMVVIAAVVILWCFMLLVFGTVVCVLAVFSCCRV